MVSDVNLHPYAAEDPGRAQLEAEVAALRDKAAGLEARAAAAEEGKKKAEEGRAPTIWPSDWSQHAH